jgi:hypothetical protein
MSPRTKISIFKYNLGSAQVVITPGIVRPTMKARHGEVTVRMRKERRWTHDRAVVYVYVGN